MKKIHIYIPNNAQDILTLKKPFVIYLQFRSWHLIFLFARSGNLAHREASLHRAGPERGDVCVLWLLSSAAPALFVQPWGQQ